MAESESLYSSARIRGIGDSVGPLMRPRVERKIDISQQTELGLFGQYDTDADRLSNSCPRPARRISTKRSTYNLQIRSQSGLSGASSVTFSPMSRAWVASITAPCERCRLGSSRRSAIEDDLLRRVDHTARAADQQIDIFVTRQVVEDVRQRRDVIAVELGMVVGDPAQEPARRYPLDGLDLELPPVPLGVQRVEERRLARAPIVLVGLGVSQRGSAPKGSSAASSFGADDPPPTRRGAADPLNEESRSTASSAHRSA